MDLVHIIDTLIGIVVAGGAWFIGTQAREVKRLDILINRTREDFVSRGELRNDLQRITDSLQRLEDRLERLSS